MTREEFRAALGSAIGAEAAELPDDRLLETLPAWDSLAQLSVIALIMEQFDDQPDLKQLAKCETVADVIALVAHRIS